MTRKKEKSIFRYIAKRRRNISRFIIVAIAMSWISLLLATPWSHARSYRNDCVNNGSSYFEMPLGDYSSEKYMLDDTSDLHYKNHYYTITFKDGTTITFRLFACPGY